MTEVGLPAKTDRCLLAEILERCRLKPRVELESAIGEVINRVRLERVGPQDAHEGASAD